jgi:putative colanic acid biosynthesis acetyltransferase WcaF
VKNRSHSVEADLHSQARADEVSGLAVFDGAANHTAVKYSTQEQIRRVLWVFGLFAMRISPRPAFAWRRAVLRLFGARVGRHVNVYPSTRIYMPWNIELGDWTAIGEDAFIYSLGKVRLGQYVTLSYRSHVCAGSHDLNDPTLPLTKPPITLGDGVWVGTEAFIGPGVSVGNGAIIGARAVVTKNVGSQDIVAGNPATVIGRRRLG